MQTGGVDSKFHTGKKKKNPQYRFLSIHRETERYRAPTVCQASCLGSGHVAVKAEGTCAGGQAASLRALGLQRAPRGARQGSEREGRAQEPLSGVQAGVSRPRPRDADPRGWTSAAGRPGPPSTFAATPAPTYWVPAEPFPLCPPEMPPDMATCHLKEGSPGANRGAGLKRSLAEVTSKLRPVG